MRFNLCWVLGLSGVVRNENADPFIKSVATNVDTQGNKSNLTHRRDGCNKGHCLKEWQRYWNYSFSKNRSINYALKIENWAHQFYFYLMEDGTNAPLCH